MKTPNDLTEKEWEVLGLHTEENNYDGLTPLPNKTGSLYVWAQIENCLSSNNFEFYFHIWQDGQIVGDNTYIIESKYSIHVLDFMSDLFKEKSIFDNQEMIDYLLKTLELVGIL